MPDYQELSDEVLVEKIRSQDKELYIHVVKRYQDKLMRYASYLVRDDLKAADIVQETFLKAYMNLNGFDVKKKFSSWIYRIAHNEAMNEVQKYKRESPLPSDFQMAGSHDVENQYSTQEVVNQVQLCLSDLPVMYAEPLALFYLDEKSYEEISDILRIPMGTVATRINRAKSFMKHLCQKHQ